MVTESSASRSLRPASKPWILWLICTIGGALVRLARMALACLHESGPGRGHKRNLSPALTASQEISLSSFKTVLRRFAGELAEFWAVLRPQKPARKLISECGSQIAMSMRGQLQSRRL